MASTWLPKTMKGVRFAKTGGTEVLEYADMSVPEPGEGQVLVRNEYIGLNYVDSYFRKAILPVPSFPFTPGTEAVGTIISTGSNVPADLVPGTRVAYTQYSGSQAQYTLTNPTYTIPVPDSVESKTAAASFVNGLTALTLCTEGYEVKKDEWVLVSPAAGGVGIWLCQVLKAKGARVIAVAGTEEKRGAAREFAGAEVVLGYPEKREKGEDEEWVKSVRDITGGNGVDAVIDGVGKDMFDVGLRVLKRKGTMVSFGNASGPVTGFSVSRLAAANITLRRPSFFNYITNRDEMLHYTAQLWSSLEKGDLRPRIHAEYPLSGIREATEEIEGRRAIGKIILKA